MVRPFLAVVLGLTAAIAWGSQPRDVWIDQARGLPVAAEGRVLPLETWAQVVYSRIAGKDRDAQALDWLLTALVDPRALDTAPFVLVNDPAVLAGTGVDARVRGRYSPRQLAPIFPLAEGWARGTDGSALGRERQRLGRALVLLDNLRATFDPSDPRASASPLKALNLSFEPMNPMEALRASLGPAERDRLALLLLWYQESADGHWYEASQVLKMFTDHSTDLELVYNRVPWAGLVAGLGWAALVGGLFFRRYPGQLAVAPWVVMTAWLVVRMVLSGRPPVTNLPSTFLLVAWVLLGVGTLLSFRPAQQLTARLALGAGSLVPLVALALEGGSDPFSPVQAVLNTNFWLGLHVTTIVAGYAVTLAAGLVGHAYLVVHGWGKAPGRTLASLWTNLRIALGVALGLTVLGTLLGGVWADQSWGRFWGWDPKENGALLVILWLALTLHLRPSGWAAEWGTALAAAVALPVLWLSWMGVNLLGLGYHSYGAAPGRLLLFLGPLAADALVLGVLTVRRVLR